ncbi:endoribonuclease ysh1 [Friedmanniomyces endolithicus]|nr:endoribonuclease ysh1 [Friedmanniomyces endolithicus]
MNRLKSRLLGLQSMKVFSPANCEELRIPFRREKVARVVGRLARDIVLPVSPTDVSDEDVEGEAKRRSEEGQLVSGVLVQNDFKLSLMAPEDLKEFAGLTTTTIRITLAAAGVELIRWALESTFGGVTIVPSNATKGKTNGDDTSMVKAQYPTNGHVDEKTVLEIMGGAVRLTHHAPSGEVEMEWGGNVSNDSIADAVMAVLLSVESSPAAVRQSSKLHSHSHHQQEAEQAKSYDAFGDSPVDTKHNGDAFAVSKHEDAASNGIRKRNPHANLTPEERLNRLFMFLEAQFGEDALSPIPYPRPQIPTTSTSTNGTTTTAEQDKAAIHAELARLHSIGIPVPGLEIRVDKLVARVWLEGLEVECGNKTLGDRVRAVVERGCGTVAPLWG